MLHKWELERPEGKETDFQTQRTGEAQMEGLVVCVTGGGARDSGDSQMVRDTLERHT